MTDVLKPNQRRSSATYFALPLSLFRRRHSAATSKIPPPSLSLASNDPLSEVIEIGQSSSTSQHTHSHADEPSSITPEDEERQRLRDAAAQSLGLDLNSFNDDNVRNGDSADSSSPSLPSRLSSKPPTAVSYNNETPFHQPGLLSPFTANSPSPMIYNPQRLGTPTKLPPYPCSYSELAPFIQISSSYLKFTAGPTNTHTSSGLAFISLPKRSKTVKTPWKLYYVVLTVPRERALSSTGYLTPSQPKSAPHSDNNLHSLLSPTPVHARNFPPLSSSSFMPSHSHLHLFKSEHPGRNEMEIDRLEINEDTVVYIADIELAGKKGLIKVTGRYAGNTNTTDDEELSRTLWILKYPDPRETTSMAPNSKIIYPDESEVQQRWVKEIKSSVLSQRAERAGFLHASSQPTSSPSPWAGNSGYLSSAASNGRHLPISPNRQLPFFPQPRPPQPILPPPNPNPRYAEHVGAAPSSAVSSMHHASANSSSSRLHSPALRFTGLRSLFQSPSPVGTSSVLKDDSSIAAKDRAVSPVRTVSRPSSRDGSGSVWSGISMGIQRTTIKEEEKEDIETAQRKDIHPMAPEERTEDYASFLTRLNTRFKYSLKVKEKERGKKDKRRPKSASAISDTIPADETSMVNGNTSAQPTTYQNEPTSLGTSQLLHPVIERPASPPNDMSVASIYSQSSAHGHSTKERRSKGHGHKRSASTGTVGTSFHSQGVAEWIASTTDVRAQGEVRTDTDSADAPMDNRNYRHSDRLSIGESLAISLSLNPPPRGQRRSTIIDALVASTLKEDWSFPPSSGSAAASDGTETPGRTHTYSRPLTLTSSDATPHASMSIQGSHLSGSVHTSSEVSPSMSSPASVPPSTRNSADFKQRAIRTSQITSPKESRNGDLLKPTEHESRAANKLDAPVDDDDDDTYTYHSEEYLTPCPVPAKPARLSSILNPSKSAFGHPTPPVYKRVSAPPATSSLTSSSNTLPPPRPPPSFAPPPPPSDLSSNGGETRRSEESSPSTKDNTGNRKAKDTVNTFGPTRKGTEVISSLLPRSFRFSLNPSPPPTQPLPLRPDEVLIDGTITVVETEKDKQLLRQRQRPHSTLAGPSQMPHKTFTINSTERPLFTSMHPPSVSATMSIGDSDLKQGDPVASSIASSVPAPQPPPQGPLPPTPESTSMEKRKDMDAGRFLLSPEGPQHSSTARRLRIMSSPPPLRKGGYEFDNAEKVDDTNSNKPGKSFDDATEPIRSRFLIPAPPRIPPPQPRKAPNERMPGMRYSTPSGALSSSVEYGVRSPPSTFLHMDDTPKTSIFPTTTMNALETALIKTDESTILTPKKMPMLGDSENANFSSDSNDFPLPIDNYEVNKPIFQHANESSLSEVDIGTGATIVIGRIIPPSPPSSLSIIAQTPSRTNSLSNLSNHSYLQFEGSADSEREEDFNY